MTATAAFIADVAASSVNLAATKSPGGAVAFPSAVAYTTCAAADLSATTSTLVYADAKESNTLRLIVLMKGCQIARHHIAAPFWF